MLSWRAPSLNWVLVLIDSGRCRARAEFEMVNRTRCQRLKVEQEQRFCFTHGTRRRRPRLRARPDAGELKTAYFAISRRAGGRILAGRAARRDALFRGCRSDAQDLPHPAPESLMSAAACCAPRVATRSRWRSQGPGRQRFITICHRPRARGERASEPTLPRRREVTRCAQSLFQPFGLIRRSAAWGIARSDTHQRRIDGGEQPFSGSPER
jgi:hypothetical protein